MTSAPETRRGILSSIITGACVIALGCGFQAAFAPTVRVTCPARTAEAPDCDLRWLVAFDQLTVRHAPLPALQPVGEIIDTAPGRRRGGATTLFLQTSAGPVRTIMWGDHLSLQKSIRDPLRSYFSDPHAAAIDLTMKATNWVDPGGTADNRLVPQAHPVRLVSHAIVVSGLLIWLWIPVQLIRKR